jgi:MFS family permease
VIGRRPPREQRSRHGFVPVVTLCVGGLTVALSQTLVVPLQSRLPELLDASPAATGWVMTCSLLVGAVVMPISGRLADVVGKRNVLLGSALLLVLGSVLCACAPGLAGVLVGRCVQGLAMGFIPVAIATVRDVCVPERVAPAIGAVSATLGLGGGVGLPLAAWIAQSYDWRVLFVCSAAAAAVVALAVWRGLPPTPWPLQRPPIDVVGALGLTLGVSTMLVAVTRAPDWGWLDPRVGVLLLASCLVFVGWGRFELARNDPICDLRVAGQRPVLLVNIAAATIGFSMMMQVVSVPQLLQFVDEDQPHLGVGLLDAGLYLVPACLVMSVCAPLGGRMAASLGAHRVLALGTSLVAVGHLAAIVWSETPWQLVASGCVLYAGVGMAYAAMPSMIVAIVAPSGTGAALGLNALVKSVGSTLAAALASTLIVGFGANAGTPSYEGFRACFAAGAAAAALATLAALFVPTSRSVQCRTDPHQEHEATADSRLEEPTSTSGDN